MTRKFYQKIWFKILAGSVLLIPLLVWGCHLVIVYSTAAKCYDDLADIPYNKVGILLGTSPILGNGNVNLYFRYRIDAAVALYNSGKIEYILVSGDNGRNDYNEPLEMQNSLIARGVPAEKIVADYAGFRTLDSVVRAQEIFGQQSFTVISQKFHNERAIYIAGNYRIDAVGYNAQDVGRAFGFKTRMREYLARVKVFVDLSIGKRPRYLGEKIHLP